MPPDQELLTRFVRNGDPDAFRQWVEDRVNLVYSVALRALCGDAHLAEDVTQQVFATAAIRARELARHPAIGGWLFTHCRYTAAKAVRTQQRRRAREHTAAMDPALSPASSIDWDQLRPQIDEALASLPAADRDAVILRYYEEADYATIGAQLKLSANAARMRVDRALDKLNHQLARRGISSTAAALGTALGAHAVGAAPAGLAATVATTALAGTTTAATTTVTLLAMLKAPLATTVLVAAAGSLLVLQEDHAAPHPEHVTALVTDTALAPTDALPASASPPAPAAASVALPTDADYAVLEQEVSTLQSRLAALDRAAVTRLQRPPLTGKIYDGKELDAYPKPVRQAPPKYPVALRNAGTTGRAVISMVIDAQGAVRDLETISATHDDFAAAALAAVSNWQFEPGRVSGAAVNSRLQIPIVFNITKAPAETPPLHEWF